MHGTLVELFEVRGRGPAARRDAAAKALLKNMEVTVGHTTGTIDLEVTTPWARAFPAGHRTDDSTGERIQPAAQADHGGAERRFAEARVAEARDSLRVAEARQRASCNETAITGTRRNCC